MATRDITVRIAIDGRAIERMMLRYLGAVTYRTHPPWRHTPPR